MQKFTHLDGALLDLLVWAAAEHGTQPYGRNHYWIHLVAVLGVALDHGVKDWDTLAACICHDILEDCPKISPQFLEEMTNQQVRDIVVQCTFTQETRKEQLEAIAEAGKTMTPRALIVKSCDTMANILSLGSGLSPQEVLHHKWMKTLPYRLRFATAALDRLQAILVPGRSFRAAEKMAHDLVFKIKYHLLTMGVTDGK